MYLGIEIGGTKLQLGVGDGRSAQLAELLRLDIAPAAGAEGIRQQIATATAALQVRHDIQRMGVGFGGPVDAEQGVIIKSHHVAGWDGFPLATWCRDTLGLPCILGNDADVAALAEAQLGAGQGADPVLYVTVGSGIGGGLIRDGRIYQGHGQAATEIGHLRPGPTADTPDAIVESWASGWGIARRAQARLSIATDTELAAKNVQMQSLAPEQLTAKQVFQAADAGDELAAEVLAEAQRVLGWALAQAITLLAPEVIVIGGGVSLAGEQWFFAPLRREVAHYVFPPLAGSYRIVPAQLGEEMVVHGALALAAG